MKRETALQLLLVWIAAPVLALVTFWGAVTVLKMAGVELTTDQAFAILIGCAIFFGLAALLVTNVLLYGAQEGEGRHRGTPTRTWHYIVLGALPISIVAIGVGLYGIVYQRTIVPEGTLAVLLLTGVIGLLTAITVATVFFHGLSLSDRAEPLGLPRGSVRAIIALSLILIFALVSIYLYSSLSAKNSAGADDLAKQLITTLSTLVVAVASFYFGASTSSAPLGTGASASAPGPGEGTPVVPAPSAVPPAGAPQPAPRETTIGTDPGDFNLGLRARPVNPPDEPDASGSPFDKPLGV
jgi:hypothetical protein